MRKFNGGIEIRITKEDLMQMVEYAFNNRILNHVMNEHVIESLSVHPEDKYILRMTVKANET